MFLFEGFDYNEDWAKSNYSDFKSTWSYLEHVVNDYDFISTLTDNRKDYIFNIGVLSELYNDNIKNVFYVKLYFDNNKALQPFQKKYIIDKLTTLGDAVKILSTDYADNTKIIFSYDIEKDEVRWNKEHKRIQDHIALVDSIDIIKPDNIDQWIWMLDSMNTGKNPRIIFKKFNEIDAKKLWFIAKVIGWNAGAINLYYKLSWLIKQTDAKNYEEALNKYLKTYTPSEEIIDLINDFRESSKTSRSIPVKAKEIAKLLQDDDYFTHFDIYVLRQISASDPIFEIEVTTKNGKTAWIVIKHYDQVYRIQAFKTRELFKRYDGSLGSNFSDEISKQFYMVTRIPGNRSFRNVTLKLLLDTFWNNVIEDIKNEYK